MANTNEKLLAALKCVAAALGQNKTFPADIAYAKRVAEDAIRDAERVPAQQTPLAALQAIIRFHDVSLPETKEVGDPFGGEPVDYDHVIEAVATFRDLSQLFAQFDEMKKILTAIQEFFDQDEAAHAGSMLFDDDVTLHGHINAVLKVK